MREVSHSIRMAAQDGTLSLMDAAEIASEIGVSLARVEEMALREDVWPLRYVRNSPAMSPSDQLRLLDSEVAVAGCGGLGGYVGILLARLGVGRIVFIDPDQFEESNLNRQVLCTLDTLGMHKAVAASAAVSRINPAACVKTVTKCVEHAEEHIQRADVVVDCLDCVGSRLHLSEICKKAGIPLVHGAVNSGWGQVAVEMPESGVLRRIYPEAEESIAGTLDSCVLAFAVSAVASLQAGEVWKLIIGLPSDLHGRWVFLDLRECEFEMPAGF